MPEAMKHPTPQELTAFGLGKLPERTAVAVAAHLESCPACLQVVAGVLPDSFLDKLRAAKPDGSSFPPSVPPPAIPNVPCPDVPPELIRHPKYLILRELGRGGMGVVYQARHKEMDRQVVIKVINRARLDRPEALERFLREIRAAAQLSHPNIVTAYDAEQAGESHMLVMEYVPGHSLAEVLKKKGPLPVAFACNFARQVALGLQHAFEKGMVHRDIKPQNLMLTPQGQVKILDFGLAKVLREENTSTGLTSINTYMGTPDYCAPEQATDARTADIRADLYSLGCTLYCLLAGHPPFQEDTFVKAILAHQQKHPQPLPELRPDVPAELWLVMARLLAKNPGERYPKPIEVAQALVPFLKSGAKADAKGRSASPPAVETPEERTAIAVDIGQLKNILREVPGKTPPKKEPPNEEQSPFADMADRPARPRRTKKARESTKRMPAVWYRRGPVLAGVGLAALLLVCAMFALATRNKPNDNVRIAQNQPQRLPESPVKSSTKDAPKQEPSDQDRQKENQPDENRQKDIAGLPPPAPDNRPRGQKEIVHFSSVDHVELSGTLYHGWKGKQGMTVLMLHDLGRDRSSPGWKRLAETLQTEGHTVLTFDFRGHGDSKKISTPFWSYSVNKFLISHNPGLTAAEQSKTLHLADLPTLYLPWLIEDIAAARTFLDVRHDEPNGPVNTFNLVVIGSGQAAALGSLWLGTEGMRFNGADVSGKTVLKPPEKLSVLQVIWLGMADPLKLRPDGIYSWLRGAAAKPAVPITFVYGEKDSGTSNLLALPLREKYGTAFVIPGAIKSGQELLDTDAQGAGRIKQYLVKTLQKLPPQPFVPRRIKTLHSYWTIPKKLPGGKEQARFYVAKRVGEETLSPVPFGPLGIAIKGLAEPASLPSVLENASGARESSKREKPISTPTKTTVARMAAELASADRSRFALLLHNYRLGKGAEFTEALALAIPQLSGENQRRVREALASRLTRMKDDTLAEYAEDSDAEIRRASAIAIGKKGSKALVPNLITLLNDPEISVVRAAHAALKALTNEDFGPSVKATREEREQAVLKWVEWWTKQRKKSAGG